MHKKVSLLAGAAMLVALSTIAYAAEFDPSYCFTSSGQLCYPGENDCFTPTGQQCHPSDSKTDVGDGPTTSGPANRNGGGRSDR